MAVLDRLRGKKAPPPSTEWISEVEAYQIVVHESRLQAADVDSPTGDRADITIGPNEPSPPPILGPNATVIDRVANRLLEAHSCVLLRSPRPVMFQCKQLAVTLAEHAYGQWTRRAGAVLDWCSGSPPTWPASPAASPSSSSPTSCCATCRWR